MQNHKFVSTLLSTQERWEAHDADFRCKDWRECKTLNCGDVHSLPIVCWGYIMVREQGRPTMESGQTLVQLGRGPITYPIVQPFESWKYVETGTSLYVGLKRQNKLARYKSITSCLWELNTLKWTLYSAHGCNKLQKNVRRHDWSWRARTPF